MKKFAVVLLSSIAFVEVIFMVIFYLWISSGGQERVGNFAQNYFTTVLQMSKINPLNENSTEVISLKNISTRCSQLTFGLVSHTMQPRFDKKSENPFLLVLITSGVENLHRTRRNGVRNTWCNEVNHQASRVWKRVFVLGKTQVPQLGKEIKQESAIFNDVLVLDIEDNYGNLIIKSYSGLLWGLVHVNPRFILKADDDVYVRIPYLVSWLNYYATERFYGGHVIRGAYVRRTTNMKNRVARDCMEEDRYAPYCSGAFYVVSSNALPLILQSVRKWTAIPVEDAYMGLLARESGLKPVDIPGFEFRNIRDYGRCNWASAVALGHGYKDILPYAYVESKLQEHSHLPRYYYECLATEWAGFILVIGIPSNVVVIVSICVKFGWCQRRGFC